MAHFSENKLNIAVLGSAQTGKSAIVVRILTGRYISEYSSKHDIIYNHMALLDKKFQMEVNILDTSNSLSSDHLFEHIDWADAFIVVYSITDQCSFQYASRLLKTISMMKLSIPSMTILMANKSDLSEHYREVETSCGQDLAQQYNCPFYEVSAADNYFDIIVSFKKLISISRPTLIEQKLFVQSTRPNRTVSQVFAKLLSRFGKNGPKNKHKSLSI
ncbi:hypothetical protein BLOT_006675 [Blomia tropicalis]|nr:hypothetical protein BLOT_006675 [Blomia tropicalis]